MKKYISIVLLFSFANQPLAQTDAMKQNSNTGCEVAYVGEKGTDGADQLNSLRRPSYYRTDFSLYMSRPPSQIESEKDSVIAVIEEEQPKMSGLAGWLVAAVCLVGLFFVAKAIIDVPGEIME